MKKWKAEAAIHPSERLEPETGRNKKGDRGWQADTAQS